MPITELVLARKKPVEATMVSISARSAAAYSAAVRYFANSTGRDQIDPYVRGLRRGGGCVGSVLRDTHRRVGIRVDRPVGVGEVGGREQVQRLLRVCQQPDRVGTPHAKIALVAEHPHRGRHRRHRVVERDRVGDIKGHEHLRRARCPCLVVDLDPPRREGGVVVGDRPVGVGVQPRLLDQYTDAVRVEPTRLPDQQPIRVVGRRRVEVA